MFSFNIKLSNKVKWLLVPTIGFIFYVVYTVTSNDKDLGQEKEFIKTDYTYDVINLKIDQLHTKKDLFFYRTSPKNKANTIQTATRILENKKISLMRSLEPTKFKGYDYNYKLGTVQLYYNSLRKVALLTDAYFLTGEKKYLDNAISTYNHWREQEKSKKITNKFVWYNHSVANRTLTLIYLLRAGNKNIDEKSRNNIVKSLVQHGLWLYDNQNYDHRGNHGVMQDRSLLELGVLLNNQPFIKRATERIERAFKRDFSKKGVHYENSIAYHTMMLNMYYGLFKLVNSQENSQIIANGKEYIQILGKPNGEFPMEGDSGLLKTSLSKKSFDCFFDRDSGKVIINDKNLTYPEKSVYIFFKSGYKSIVHKHFDDLSFVYTHNGNNIFIDSGKYNYESKDPYRKYILSPKAHNTIYIDDIEYSLNKKRYNPSITYYKKALDWIYTQGVIHMENKILERNLIYSEGVIFLIDKGKFTTTKRMHQNFNISKKMKTISIEEKKSLIQNGDKSITITQYHKVDGVEKFYGDEKKIRGFISKQFNKLIPIYQIDYSIRSKNPIFLTEISPDIDNIKTSDVSFNPKTNMLYFSINGVKRKVQLASSEL